MDFDVAIVGAGFGGLIAALELRRTGRESFVILERGEEVGGVWRDTLYPGCACDVPSHLYSIAARPNPGWTTNFAGQSEILEYLKAISVRDDLRRHIRFGRDVVEARFCAEAGCWRLTDRQGGSVRARVLILALGPHSRPKLPTINGQERFAGTTCHSSRWDPSLDLTGQSVAVIGTGASAVQIVPSIAQVVKELTVVQRSPAWVLPRGERTLSGLEQRLYQRFPAAQTLSRATIYWTMEMIGLAFVGPRVFNRALEAVARRQLRAVDDPATRQALTPSYRTGCKRVMVSDDYYPAFNRPNVRLVTEPIAEIVRDGIVTQARTFHPADHIVYATGFTVADPDGFLRVVGLDGRVMGEEWAAEGASAYLGTTVTGYPNLALLLGPNSGLSHSSALLVMESQMAYISKYLDAVTAAGDGGFVDVRASVQAAYNADLQERLSRMIWSSGCRSWYMSRNGRNTVIFPGLTATFRRRLRRFDGASYSIFRPGIAGEVRARDG